MIYFAVKSGADDCTHSPKGLTLAAAEQADQEGDDNNPTNHGQADNQRLEVHCQHAQGHDGNHNSTAKTHKHSHAVQTLGEKSVNAQYVCCQTFSITRSIRPGTPESRTSFCINGSIRSTEPQLKTNLSISVFSLLQHRPQRASFRGQRLCGGRMVLTGYVTHDLVVMHHRHCNNTRPSLVCTQTRKSAVSVCYTKGAHTK